MLLAEKSKRRPIDHLFIAASIGSIIYTSASIAFFGYFLIQELKFIPPKKHFKY